MNQDIKRMLLMIASFIGINLTYIVSGLLYQKLAKNSYYNIENNHYDRFHSSIGYSMILRVIVWILSEIFCIVTLKKDEYVAINKKYSFVCGLIIVVASISFMESLYLISFPFIMMVKSSSVLQTALMGVFCNQTKDQREKVGKNKIMTSIIATLGVILFKLCDPETSFKSQILRQTQLLGFLLLLINLCADNFLTDFQTEIKYDTNPKPAQLLVEVSRWGILISLLFSILTGDFLYAYNFVSQHPSFTHEILVLGMLIFAGQAFVNKLVQNFESKIVPLIVGGKKFFTVFLNLIHFDHRTSYGQFIGIFIAFSATIWQFLEILVRNLVKERVKQPQNQFNNFSIQSTFEALPNKEDENQNGFQRIDNPQNSLNSIDQEKQFVLRQT